MYIFHLPKSEFNSEHWALPNWKSSCPPNIKLWACTPVSWQPGCRGLQGKFFDLTGNSPLNIQDAEVHREFHLTALRGFFIHLTGTKKKSELPGNFRGFLPHPPGPSPQDSWKKEKKDDRIGIHENLDYTLYVNVLIIKEFVLIIFAQSPTKRIITRWKTNIGINGLDNTELSNQLS